MCSNRANHPWIAVEFPIDEQQDGLLLQDHLKRINRMGLWLFVNPPFNLYHKFATTAMQAFLGSYVVGVIFLVYGKQLTMMEQRLAKRHVQLQEWEQQLMSVSVQPSSATHKNA